MPLYEYQCDACANRFEVIQKFSDDPIQTCPVCGGTVRKLLSSPAIQFKGSGWYVTDYARKGGGAAGARDEGGDKPSEAKPADGKGATAPSEGGAGTASAPAGAGTTGGSGKSPDASAPAAKKD